MNCELQRFKLVLEKAEEPEVKLPMSVGSLKKKEFQKNICFIDYVKAFVWITANCGKFLEMGISLYLSPEKPICRTRSNRTRHGTTDWFQIGKGVRQGCILSPYLFNLCAEYIMRNAGLAEAQARIEIARRNISNLRYADDTIL